MPLWLQQEWLIPSLNLIFIFITLCVWLFCLHRCVRDTSMQYLEMPEEIRCLISGSGIAYGCEPICGCWNSKHGLLQEQQIVLTAELLFQLPFLFLKLCFMYSRMVLNPRMTLNLFLFLFFKIYFYLFF